MPEPVRCGGRAEPLHARASNRGCSSAMHVQVEEAIDDVNVAVVFAVMEVQVGGRDEDGHRLLLESMEAWQGVDAAGAIDDVEAQHAVPTVSQDDLGLRGGGQEMKGLMVPHVVVELRWPYGQLVFWREDVWAPPPPSSPDLGCCGSFFFPCLGHGPWRA